MPVAENFCRKISSLPSHIQLKIFNDTNIIDCYHFFEMSFNILKVDEPSIIKLRFSIYKDLVQKITVDNPKDAILFIHMLSVVSKNIERYKEKDVRYLDLSGYKFSKEQLKEIFKLCPFLKSVKINNIDLNKIEKYLPESVEKLTLTDDYFLPRFKQLGTLSTVTQLACENKLHNLLYQDWTNFTYLKEIVWVLEDSLYANLDKPLKLAKLPPNLVSFVIRDPENTIQTFKYHSRKNFLENLWTMVPDNLKEKITLRYESPRFLLTVRCREGALDAYVTIYTKNKTKLFQGVWNQDHLNGHGILHLADGTQYRGVWNHGVLKKGGIIYAEDWQQTLAKTKLVFFNFITGIYVGDGKNEKPEGDGVSYYLNGALWYRGQYSLGMRSGKGIEYYSKGIVKYDGKFTCDALWGKGTFYYLDGSKAIGSFVDSKLEGEASRYDKNGALLFSGLFKNGFPVWGREYYPGGGISFEGSYHVGKKAGEGREFYENGSPKFYGEFKHGQRSGRGNQYNRDGSILKGLWERGQLIEGQEYDSSNNICYEGSYNHEHREGMGTEYTRDGFKYVGFWEKGKREGYGTEYDPEGKKVYKGNFKGNLYDGVGRLYVKGISHTVEHQAGIIQREGMLLRALKYLWKR
jgi:antitoxin component YwqK of YwqJK toxin-antitoxin module